MVVTYFLYYRYNDFNLITKNGDKLKNVKADTAAKTGFLTVFLICRDRLVAGEMVFSSIF